MQKKTVFIGLLVFILIVNNIFSQNAQIQSTNNSNLQTTNTFSGNMKEKIETEKKETAKLNIYPLKTAGLIIGGIGLIGIGTAFYLNYEVKKNTDKADALYNDYLNATSDFNTKWNTYSDIVNLSKKQQTAAYIIGISSCLVVMPISYSFITYSKPAVNNVSFRISPNQMQLVFKF